MQRSGTESTEQQLGNAITRAPDLAYTAYVNSQWIQSAAYPEPMKPSSLDPAQQQQGIAILAALMFLFMLVLALIPGLKAVEGLTFPASVDFHRDAAFVRAVVEGHYGEDPIYLGASLWFTPLVGWIEAAVVQLTGLPVDFVIIRIGAYSNLLAPIAFFIMMWYFFGPVRAVAAVAVFLFFIIGREPGWAVPTYSPRLIPVSFCQWFLYIEAIFIHRAFRTTRIAPSLLAGAGAGITFLAHAAPALIAVLLIATFTVRSIVLAIRAKDGTYGWQRLRASIAAGAAFFLFSLPLTFIVVGQYGMKVVNRAYFLYNYYGLTLRNSDIFLYHNVVVINLVAAVGLWLLLRRKIRDSTGKMELARWILITWSAWAFVLMVYSWLVAMLDSNYGIQLKGILPAFHFYFYVKATWVAFAGLAVWHGYAWLAGRFADRGDPVDRSKQLRPVVVFFALIAIAVTLHYPAYATRRDVFAVRNRNLEFMERTNHGEACVRINALLPWDAVILCEVDLSIWPLLPSARKVVATVPNMGNPYLDQSQRNIDSDHLIQGMHQPQDDTRALLDAYKVTHLLVRPGDLSAMHEAGNWFTTEVFRNDEYVLLAR